MVKSALILPHFANDEIYKMTKNLKNKKIAKNNEKSYFHNMLPRASRRLLGSP